MTPHTAACWVARRSSSMHRPDPLGAASNDFPSEDLKRASHGTGPEVLRLKPRSANCPDPAILGNRLKREGAPVACALSFGAALRPPATGIGGVSALSSGGDDGKTIDGRTCPRLETTRTTRLSVESDTLRLSATIDCETGMGDRNQSSASQLTVAGLG